MDSSHKTEVRNGPFAPQAEDSAVEVLRDALKDTLNAMDIQESRMNDEFFLSAEAMRPIWYGAKEKARAALARTGSVNNDN